MMERRRINPSEETVRTRKCGSRIPRQTISRCLSVFHKLVASLSVSQVTTAERSVIEPIVK